MIGALVKGMATTLSELFQPKRTVSYPEVPPEIFPRYRGRHILQRHEDGLERCIGCSLCSAACPADAIYVEAAENTSQQRHSHGERFAKVYEINMLRCIFCGYCEQACPVDAVVLTARFELADYRRTDFIYTKSDLLVPVGTPPLEKP
ncbi:MAG: NADH-quinone oxidoreductase subunit NuoI [Deinococcus sp.]|nr:NADH-quinone oxidoreductase subunit NuoI [Deinococcus sp.]